MNEPRFLLKDKNAPDETLVYLVFRIHGERVKISTGVKVSPKEWNFTKQQMYERRGTDFQNKNQILQNYSDKIKKIVTNLQAQGKTVTVSEVRSQFSYMAKISDSKFKYVHEYCNFFIDDFKKRKPNSARFFGIATEKLKKFNPRLRFSELNEINYNRFIDFMNAQKYSANYTGATVNRLRIIFNDAYKKNILRHTDWQRWKRLNEEVYKVYLTEEEIQRIYNLSIPKDYARVRDLFIVGCCTGLRVGNYLTLDPKININNGYIHAVVNKNGPRVMIPVHWMVSEILAKCNGLPKPVSEQRLNKKIKEICRAAKITQPVQWYRNEGGKRVIYTTEKCDLVTSHTARRSFATNLYLRGENPKVIMAVTGHTTVEMFFRYIKITAEESSKRLSKNVFFKKSDKM
jgi:integrase